MTSLGFLSGLSAGAVTRKIMRAWVSVCLLLIPLSAPQVTAATSWNYTALGDSIAFGLYAPPGKGYVPLYAGYVATDNRVSVKLTNLGVPGWTSASLLSAVRTNILFRFSLAGSSVITLDIGGNDLLNARDQYKARTCGGADNQNCLRSAVTTFKANWSGILAEVLSLRRVSNTIIRTMDIYNPFVKADKAADTWPGDQGNDFVVLKPYLDEINSYIASSSAANGISSVKVYRAFNGPNGDVDPGSLGYIAFDGYHPNGRGHQVIADLFRGAGYAPLRP